MGEPSRVWQVGRRGIAYAALGVSVLLGCGGNGASPSGGVASAGDASLGEAGQGEPGAAGSGGSPGSAQGGASHGGSEPNGPGSAGTGATGEAGDGAVSGQGGEGGENGPGDACRKLEPLQSGTCQVAPGDAARLITGNVLLASGVLHGGQVLIDKQGVITCSACDCSAAAGAETATQITCPSGVISPGLLNLHDHLPYDAAGPYPLTADRYEHRHQWRMGLDDLPQITATAGAVTATRWAELRSVFAGVTSVLGAGSVAGLARNLDQVNASGLALAPTDDDTFPLDDAGGLRQSSGCGYPNIVTRSVLDGASAFVAHAAEGISVAARNEFLCLSSENGGGHDLLSFKTTFVHGVGLLAEDFYAMANASSSLVWSPRSNLALYGDTARVTEAARLGVNLALGTDWSITGSMSLQRELACAASFNAGYLDSYFDDQALWGMVTGNAARAAGVRSKLGALAPGLVGDIAIFDGRARPDFAAVVEATADSVVLVLRAGAALYGDKPLLDALAVAESCETIDVCEVEKRACVSSETGQTLAQLRTLYELQSPLFSCTAPENEPTCVPSRGVSVSGSTIYSGAASAQDGDGDGIDDASDDCPNVFNPVRPLDSGMQADFDEDGEGDACDACPLNAPGEGCDRIDPQDRDQDGVPTVTDNCPELPNAQQEDADGDGKGDACDACPADENPGAQACPASIYDIKQSKLPLGAHVSLRDQLVTASNASGFYLQDVGEQGAPLDAEYSGIFVALANSGLELGDRIDIDDATIAGFFGVPELVDASGVQVLSTSDEAPEPTLVDDPVELLSGGKFVTSLDGVVVVVMDEVVKTADPGAKKLTLLSGLSVDAAFYGPEPFPVAGQRFDAVIGVLRSVSGGTVLSPRGELDLLLGPPGLSALGPSGFVYLGVGGAASAPTPMKVVMTGPVATNTFVAIASSSSNLEVVGAGVTVLAGNTEAPVAFTGVAAESGITLTASLAGVQATSTITVLQLGAQPNAVVLTPAQSSVDAGGTVGLTLSLDVPAPPGGTQVALALAPPDAGTLPPTVLVPAGQLSTTFNYVDAATQSSVSITAAYGGSQSTALISRKLPPHLVINEIDYDQPGSDAGEFIELLNTGPDPVSLTSLQLLLVNGASPVTVYESFNLVDASQELAGGQYLVIHPSTASFQFPPGVLTLSRAFAIQNGAPDGVLLVNNATKTVLDALSYEGSTALLTLAGFPPINLVEGLVPPEDGDVGVGVASLMRWPNGTDTNHADLDWALGFPTPGRPNEQP